MKDAPVNEALWEVTIREFFNSLDLLRNDISDHYTPEELMRMAMNIQRQEVSDGALLVMQSFSSFLRY